MIMKKEELKPFDKVLVRADNDCQWKASIFSHYNDGKAVCVSNQWKYCIPYEGNENLLGKTDDYVEHYVPQDGDFVTADDSKDSTIFVYNEKESNPKYFGEYIGLYRGRNDLSLWKSDAWCDRHRKLRLATKEEKQLLLSKLAEIGKKWNPEKKCIEDVWEPIDGDFVYVKTKNGNPNNELVFIHHYKDSEGRIYSHAEYCLKGQFANQFEVIPDNDCHLVWRNDCVEYRLATDSEKQQLLDALHKKGKDWDAEKKEIVDYKWKPKQNKDYLFINSLGEVCKTYWSDDCTSDTQRYTLGNCFRTEAEAKIMADKFKELLKGE